MFKKIFSICCLLYLLTLGTAEARTHESPPENVLLVYQERNFFGDRRDSVSVIEELMGHYNVKLTESTLEKLPLQTLSLYDAVFIIALDQTIENPALIQALVDYKGDIIWLGNSVNTLIEAGDYPLNYEGENYNFVTLEIQPPNEPEPQIFSIGEKRVFYQVSSQSDENTVYAWLSDGLNRSPFIVKSRNLSFVSRVDMNEPLFYIFAYFLHDLFNEKSTPSDQLMVSIQDVHGFSDQKNLRALADEFYRLDIPFNIQLIPYFKLNGSKRWYRYDEIPQFVETLHYIEDRGGSIVLEAFPAELGEKTIRAFGLEELYGNAQIPLKAYLQEMMHLLISHKLQPVGISSPHRALTDAEYLYAKAHMSSFIGHRYIASDQLVIYPYVLENTKRFNRLYPLNLGYIDPNQPESSAVFEEQFYKISLVPDYFAGVYLSPDLPVEFISTLVDKSHQYRLTFFDLKKEPYWFHTDLINFYSTKDKTDNLYIKTNSDTIWTRFIGALANSILFILVIGLILFVVILRRSLKQTDDIHRRR